jgi:hypothetical protein
VLHRDAEHSGFAADPVVAGRIGGVSFVTTLTERDEGM